MDTFQFLLPQETLDIYDSLPVGIYIVNAMGTVLYVNNAMCKLSGVPKDLYLGASIFTGTPYAESVTRRVLESRQTVTAYQDINNTFSGRKYRQLITSSPVLDAMGEVQYIIAMNEELPSLSARLTDAALREDSSVSLGAAHQEDRVIAESPQMREILALLDRISTTSASVLIEGESGTGKEVIANLVHQRSARRDKPFVAINCAALPEQLLEGELFGYVKGAFTGASNSGKKGLMEEADGGTLFLDEINSLPLSIQGKLLRVLETRHIRRLGSTTEVAVDFRLVSATNQNLHKLCSNGQFREDLFYRLNVVPVHLPPLRQRREDIIPLIQFFLDKYIQLYGRVVHFSPDALHTLRSYQWPGNVRELRNVVERLVVSVDHSTGEIKEIPAAVFDGDLTPPEPPAAPAAVQLPMSVSGGTPWTEESFSLEGYMAQTEEALLRQLAGQCRTLSEMAEILKLDRTNVGRKLKRYGIQPKRRQG